MPYKDQLGVEIEVGDIVAVGSNSAIRIGKVYAFGCYGQPLCEPLIERKDWRGPGYRSRKGDLGTSYIIIRRGARTLPELEAIIGE